MEWDWNGNRMGMEWEYNEKNRIETELKWNEMGNGI